MLNFKRNPILYSPIGPINEALPGSVGGLFQKTNPLPAKDDSYVHKPIHMGTVAGMEVPLLFGYDPLGPYNRIVGRMFADHFLFLKENRLTPSKRYFSHHMDCWLYDWSAIHNVDFHAKVFEGKRPNEFWSRHWNMPNTEKIRDQLQELQDLDS